MRPRRPLLALLIGLLTLLAPAASAAPLAAEPPAPTAQGEALAGSPGLSPLGAAGGSAVAVALSPPYAYLAQGASLVVLDISGASPRRLGAVPLPRLALDIVVAGDYAYVLGAGLYFARDDWGVDTDATLLVIDIAQPTGPRLVASLGSFASLLYGGLAVAGDRLYVAAGGLHAFRLAAPATPELLGSASSPRSSTTMWDIATAGGFAYVAAGSDGLRVYDLRQGAPVEVGAFDPGGEDAVALVTLAGGFAYTYSAGLANGGVLRALSLANPAAPERVASLTGVSEALGIAADGGGLYLSQAQRVAVYSLASPAAPVAAGAAELPDLTPGALALTADRLYAVAGAGGLSVLSRDGQNLTPAGGYSEPAVGYPLAIGDGRGIAGMYAGIGALDLSDPSWPRAEGPVAEGIAERAVIAGDHAYLITRAAGLRVLALDGELREVGALDTPGAAIDVAVAGESALLLDEGGVQQGQGALRSIAVGAPAQPIELDALALELRPGRLARYGRYAYIVPACAEGLTTAPIAVVDASDPAALTAVGSFQGPCAWQAQPVVVGDHLYIAEGRDCIFGSCDTILHSYSLADPAAPAPVGSQNLGSGAGAQLVPAAGHLLLMAEITTRITPFYAGIVRLVDLGEPAVPRVAASYVLPAAPGSVAVAGPNIYVASRGGMSVLRAPALFAPIERVYLPLARR